MAEMGKYTKMRRILLFVIGIILILRAFFAPDEEGYLFYLFLAMGCVFIFIGVYVILTNRKF